MKKLMTNWSATFKRGQPCVKMVGRHYFIISTVCIISSSSSSLKIHMQVGHWLQSQWCVQVQVLAFYCTSLMFFSFWGLGFTWHSDTNCGNQSSKSETLYLSDKNGCCHLLPICERTWVRCWCFSSSVGKGFVPGQNKEYMAVTFLTLFTHCHLSCQLSSFCKIMGIIIFYGFVTNIAQKSSSLSSQLSAYPH